MHKRPRTILLPLPPYSDAEAESIGAALVAIAKNTPPDSVQALLAIAQNIPSDKLYELGEIAKSPKRLAFALKYLHLA